MVALAISPCAQAQAPAPGRLPITTVHVLAIGVSSYGVNALPNLHFAKEDADAFGELMSSRFGYQVRSLIDERATKAAIDLQKGWIQEHADKDSAVIVYFAGHGVTCLEPGKDTEPAQNIGYIIPYGTGPLLKPAVPNADAEFDPALLRKEAVSVESLRSWVQALKVKHAILILDSCFSGLAVSSRDGPAPVAQAGPVRDALYWHQLNQTSRIILTAGTRNDKSLEHTPLSRSFDELTSAPSPLFTHPIKHGVYTCELLTILSRPDPIGVHELYNDLQHRVYAVSNNIQVGGEMTPLMKHVGDDNTDAQFIFVPKPADEWAKSTVAALTNVAARQDLDTAVATRSADLKRRAVNSSADFWLTYRTVSEMTPGDRSMVSAPDWVERFTKTRQAANAGDSRAMATLALMYASGLGVEPNPARANTAAHDAYAAKTDDGRIALQLITAKGVGEKANDQAAKALEAEVGGRNRAIAGTLAAAQAARGRNIAGFGAGLFAAVQGLDESSKSSIALGIAHVQTARETVRAAIDSDDARHSSLSSALDDFKGQLKQLDGQLIAFRKQNSNDVDMAIYTDYARVAANNLNNAAVNLRKLAGGPASKKSLKVSFDATALDLARLFAVLPLLEPPAPPTKK